MKLKFYDIMNSYFMVIGKKTFFIALAFIKFKNFAFT